MRVPVRYGDASRQAQTVLQNNSASTMPATPLMTFYITDLKYDRPRIQDPTFVSNMPVRQRTYDSNTGTYETTQGNAFNVERLMPVPFELTINLDIWTSNTNQKMQILEQILVLFNPSLEIQSTDSFLDWTSLSVLYLDNTKWTNRTIPGGTENPIDIATLTFKLPIWITSPAKVKKLGVVERIIASVFDGSGNLNSALLESDLLLGTRQRFTPYGYQVLLINNKLQALRHNDQIDQSDLSLSVPDSPPTNLLWHNIINLYGTLRPGISYINLEQPDETDVSGYVSYDPTDDRFLLFNVETGTVPANTLSPVDAVINPLVSGPEAGLVAPIVNQRYLLTEDTGSYANADIDNPIAWQGSNGQPLVARANDIIEYNGTHWEISFDSTSSPTNMQYVTNLTTEIQYRWTGSMWVKSYQGLYPGGSWSLVL